jgi:3-phosphoshikimate 1-carboxyvinyltransferase
MLRGMGAQLTICEDSGVEVAIEGGQTLEAIDIAVPGDVSSAAFFLVAAAAQEGAELVLRDVGLNPTRTGVIDVLRRMGAEIEVEDLRDQGVEPIGDLRVRGRGLKGVTVEGDEIPRVIDELPVLAIAASLAEGETIVRNAEELRVKESDRIESTLAMLFSLGAEAAELDDGFIVSGRSGQPLRGGGEIHARGDHRIAMAGIVGASLSSHPSRVHGAECMDVSYPGFVSALNGLRNA